MINATREKVSNPNYGMTFGQEGAQEPPFLEGDIESITILVPKAAEELLYFAVDNGTLHVSIVPHAAVLAGASPSTGVLWEDIVRFFQEERLRALGREVQDALEGLPTFAEIAAGENQEVTIALNDGEPVVLADGKVQVAQNLLQPELLSYCIPARFLDQLSEIVHLFPPLDSDVHQGS